MFGLGPTELIIIAVIVLLIFGAKRLPEIGKGLGGAVREFRNVKKELNPEKPPAGEEKKPTEGAAGGTSPRSLETQVAGKVLEQVPGVKTVMDAKKKADAVKKLLS